MTDAGQMTLADAAEGLALKEDGLDLLERHHGDFLAIMREVAIRRSQKKGSVTVDDLRTFATRHGLAPAHQNAWGGVFRGPGWHCIGFTQSAVPSNHCRTVRVWRHEP